MHTKHASLGIALGLALAGCGPTMAPDDEASSSADIIGGRSTSAYPAVMALFAGNLSTGEGALCTASVIAPRVLITAAHCVSPEEVGPDASFVVMTGNNINTAPGQELAVASVMHDSAFDVNNLDGGHDVGAVILEQPVSVTPLPVNRTTSAELEGKSVRLVGYGVNSGPAQTGAGIKRTVTTTITTASTTLLRLGDSDHGTCQGDSGGPALVTIGGKETIVGVTSFGADGCGDGGYDTRLDHYGKFIDNALAKGR